MNQPSYPFATDKQSFRFEFVSTGKTLIRKAVIFEPLDGDNIFNLAMGGVNEEGDLDVFTKKQ